MLVVRGRSAWVMRGWAVLVAALGPGLVALASSQLGPTSHVWPRSLPRPLFRPSVTSSPSVSELTVASLGLIVTGFTRSLDSGTGPPDFFLMERYLITSNIFQTFKNIFEVRNIFLESKIFLFRCVPGEHRFPQELRHEVRG